MATTPRTPAADPDPGPGLLARATAGVLGLCRPARKLADSSDRIHRLRVATRRAQAIAAVLAPRLGPESTDALTTPLRKLRRAAGRARDPHIRLTILNRELPNPDKPARRLIKQLKQQHAAALDRLRRAAKNRRAQLADAIKPARDQLKKPGPAFAALLARADRALSARAARLASGSLEDPSRLHQLRRALKRLRYTLELADAAKIPAPGFKPRLRRLARLQKVLGDWNDLRITLESLAAAQGAGQPSLQQRRLNRRAEAAQARAIRAVRAWKAGASQGNQITPAVRPRPAAHGTARELGAESPVEFRLQLATARPGSGTAKLPR